MCRLQHPFTDFCLFFHLYFWRQHQDRLFFNEEIEDSYTFNFFFLGESLSHWVTSSWSNKIECVFSVLLSSPVTWTGSVFSSFSLIFSSTFDPLLESNIHFSPLTSWFSYTIPALISIEDKRKMKESVSFPWEEVKDVRNTRNSWWKYYERCFWNEYYERSFWKEYYEKFLWKEYYERTTPDFCVTYYVRSSFIKIDVYLCILEGDEKGTEKGKGSRKKAGRGR